MEYEVDVDAENRGSHVESPQLDFLHVMFRLADGEVDRRLENNGRNSGTTTPKRGVLAEAEQITAVLRSHIENLGMRELSELRTKLARSFLIEVDRSLAMPGKPPGQHHNLQKILERTGTVKPSAKPIVGLISLPWMSPALPSIQLATLASVLKQDGIESDVHELNVDYAARIGLNLYNHLSNLLGFLPEWVFSRHYYGPEHGDDLSDMIAQRPLDEIPFPEYSDAILHALDPVTGEFLEHVADTIDWSRYDVLGCSLTISQLGASMAFVRRIKLRHPNIKIIFGGSQCAGIMGRTILRICPYVDVVVHVEGELVLSELVRRLRENQSLAGMAGVSYRGDHGEIVSGETGELYQTERGLLPLRYDAYFQRLVHLGLTEKMNPWLPFESSRGCWYGQKVQCTFCGLHEIMEFRAWDADEVLAQLEQLEALYGAGRFYSMDLILPREFLRTLLPEIIRRGHDWMFFYEMKANMRREEVKILADSGVRWVQPGIESLDGDLLRLMKKGVTPAQNIRLLKWCEEFEIFCGWNLLFGLPGEKAESYRRMTAMIPKLVHLRPPSGGGQFQLHRFSPYFDRPDKYGIRWTGANQMFKYAFPIPKKDLDELVYLHDFVLESDTARIDTSDLQAALTYWRRAYAKKASLRITESGDGSSRIEDTRQIASPARLHELNAAETTLYLFLDSGIRTSALEGKFADAHPEAARAIGRRGGLERILAAWKRDGLVLEIGGNFVTLALTTSNIRRNVQSAPPVGVEFDLAT